jgi:hypothetical protein
MTEPHMRANRHFFSFGLNTRRSGCTQCLGLKALEWVNVPDTQDEAEWSEFSASRLSRHSQTGYFLSQSQQNTCSSPKHQEMCKCPRGHFLGV